MGRWGEKEGADAPTVAAARVASMGSSPANQPAVSPRHPLRHGVEWREGEEGVETQLTGRGDHPPPAAWKDRQTGR